MNGTRLLTLIGVGGCGKSTLALELARSLIDDYLDGVWWVDLSGLSEPELIWHTIAEAAEIQLRPDLGAAETVMALLERAQALLVLDNCEHVIDACAHAAARLLAACPDLQLLACSREALNIPGESLWRVAPLEVPLDPSSLPLKQLAAFSAVRLFVERVAAADPAIEVSRDYLVDVAEICRRLDGIPLAIELAAARVATMPAAVLAQHLDDRFQLLTGGRRTAIERHQTLHAAIDWSHQLLSPDEQVLFRRLAIFTGSFRIEEAEAVCATEPLAPAEVPDLLMRLVAKSMVAPADERGRCSMAETIRMFARERLDESGEVTEVGARHFGRYAAMAAAAAAVMDTPSEGAAFDQLENDHDNLRAALRWALGQGGECGLDMCLSLDHFWDVRGHVEEGRRWFERALAAAPDSAPLKARGWAAVGWYETRQGDLGSAERSLRLGLQLLPAGSALESEVPLLDNLGMLALFRTDLESARERFAQALAAADSAGDSQRRPGVLFHLALTDYFAGRSEAAEALGREALAAREHQRRSTGVAYCLGLLGSIAVDRREFASARRLLDQAMELMEELADRIDLAFGLELCARLAIAERRFRRALLLAGAAAALRATFGAANLELWARLIDLEVEAATRSIGAGEARLARLRGAALSADDAVAVARDPARGDERVTAVDATLLSHREAEIARLVAEGHTNKEIAKSLFIATRTAETHVQNILNKLGLSSRAQIAVWAVHHGLGEAAEPHR